MTPHMVSPRVSTGAPYGSSPLVLHLATVDVSVRHLLLPQLRFLQGAGYNVAVASNPGPGATAAEEAGITFLPVPMARKLLSPGHVRTLRRLVRLLRTRDVGLLHVHTPVAATLGRVAAWLAGTPVVFYTAHGFYFHEYTPARYRGPLMALEWLLGRTTDHLFTQSAEDLETARRHGITRVENSSYLGNGVDVEAFAAVSAESRDAVRRELGLNEEVVVAFTGRFVREKGIAELVHAFARVHGDRPGMRLLIIGGALPSDRDPAEADLAALVARPGIGDAIITTGFTDRVAEYLSAADIFVLPSYREGMPRSILEAMAAGRPVVATNVRGSREEVVDGATGFLAPVRDAERLAKVIGRLADDPDLRTRMGTAGQARARELFDERHVFDRLLDVYRRYLPLEGT
jgi:glycosyltransferase involved in cell wall biosynthesis